MRRFSPGSLLGEGLKPKQLEVEQTARRSDICMVPTFAGDEVNAAGNECADDHAEEPNDRLRHDRGSYSPNGGMARRGLQSAR